MRLLRSRLTYANVIATLALFLALTGGVVWAAGKVGSHRLKKNSVTAAKIKRNAVTTPKLHGNAVTTAKLKALAVTNAKLGEGSVNFPKIAAGTNVIAVAGGGPVPVNSVNSAIPIPLGGVASFTPTGGVTDLLSIEARAIDLARSGTAECAVVVQPLINGQPFQVGSGFLELVAPPEKPSDVAPVLLDSETGPVGLGQPGVPQTISMRVIGDTDCTNASQVAVDLSIAQLK